MLHEFLNENRTELIERCRAKVALRAAPRATPKEMEHGIPLFLGQLIETLRYEESHAGLENRKASGHNAEGDRFATAEMTATASKHGYELLRKGFTVDQVVHDYGDLCQAITELAFERNAPVAPDEFRTLNGCLDNAIADAVSEFSRQRDELVSDTGDRAMSERLRSLSREMRNCLNSAALSFAAIRGGGVGLQGATSVVLETSLVCLRDLIDGELADARLAAGMPSQMDDVAVDRFINEVQLGASLEARASGCEFSISPVEAGLGIRVDKAMLYSAVSNLLFTRPHSQVFLRAFGTLDRVFIEVEDRCVIPFEETGEAMSLLFARLGANESRLGLGLSIARRAVEASGGKLRVRDIPGSGCVFTIDLPRHELAVELSPGVA
jgi:signal transduction histidine kinase